MPSVWHQTVLSSTHARPNNSRHNAYIVIQCRRYVHAKQKDRPLPRISDPLYWDDNNLQHLLQSHQVTPDEVEEVLFGVDGEEATYRLRSDGDFLMAYGETGSGRLLKLVGEFTLGEQFRVFAARDMNEAEKRAFRKG